MATEPMKSQPLHNFSLPLLKWSTHQQNRTLNPSATDTSEPDNDDDESTRYHRVVGSRSSRVQRLSFTSSTVKPQNAAERVLKQKCVSAKDLPEKALKEPAVLEKNETVKEEEEEREVVGKPWNLRPRKVQEALFNVEVLENQYNNIVNTKAPKSTRLREMVESRGNNGEKKEKNKLWLTLSREEVEEDIFIMTGSRPARRPKKRPKNVQKQLDNVFPGLWLMGLTVDSYRIADAPIKK